MDNLTRKELLQIMTPETDEQLRWTISSVYHLSRQAVMNPGTGGGLVGLAYNKYRARRYAEMDTPNHAAETVLTDIAATVAAIGATHGTSGGARVPYIGLTSAP